VVHYLRTHQEGYGESSKLVYRKGKNAGAHEDQVTGSADPPPRKLGAEVRNCIWRLCRTDVKVMAMTTCVNLDTLETTCLHSHTA